MDRVVAFWLGRDLRLDFSLRLPVPEEKRKLLLLNHGATSVTLDYLSLPKFETEIGLEFLSHRPSRMSGGNTGLILGLRGNKPRTIEDPDGNQLVFHPSFEPGATVVLKSRDPSASGDVLERLGFLRDKISKKESDALGLDAPGGKVWTVTSPVFFKRRLRVILQKDARRSIAPPVDGF